MRRHSRSGGSSMKRPLHPSAGRRTTGYLCRSATQAAPRTARARRTARLERGSRAGWFGFVPEEPHRDRVARVVAQSREPGRFGRDLRGSGRLQEVDPERWRGRFRIGKFNGGVGRPVQRLSNRERHRIVDAALFSHHQAGARRDEVFRFGRSWRRCRHDQCWRQHDRRRHRKKGAHRYPPASDDEVEPPSTAAS